jgi:hypothetical protein
VQAPVGGGLEAAGIEERKEDKFMTPKERALKRKEDETNRKIEEAK